MSEPQLKARDKVVLKMTREGAVEENLATGEVERISERAKDAELVKKAVETTSEPKKNRKTNSGTNQTMIKLPWNNLLRQFLMRISLNHQQMSRPKLPQKSRILPNLCRRKILSRSIPPPTKLNGSKEKLRKRIGGLTRLMTNSRRKRSRSQSAFLTKKRARLTSGFTLRRKLRRKNRRAS